MKEQLYLKILAVLKRVEDYFNAKLGAYYVEQNHKYADAFLEGYRSRRPKEWWERLWFPDEREPWARKPKPDPFCTHLKGGAGRPKYQVKDYSVAMHTFVTGRTRIWCTRGCGFESYKGDRNWQQAWQMMESSSNRPSSSERTIIKVQGDGRA